MTQRKGIQHATKESQAIETFLGASQTGVTETVIPDRWCRSIGRRPGGVHGVPQKPASRFRHGICADSAP
ncbi:hypothetical protein SBA4_80008 [Candidatus Sulfopaludibacter sp. SbA4]|nr:hypothetical protein SBA4_80008 [Candidatus Sulfopaludibacter sp. SbA4]